MLREKQIYMLLESFYNVAGQCCEKSTTVSFQKKKVIIEAVIIRNRIFSLTQIWSQGEYLSYMATLKKQAKAPSLQLGQQSGGIMYMCF